MANHSWTTSDAAKLKQAQTNLAYAIKYGKVEIGERARRDLVYLMEKRAAAGNHSGAGVTHAGAPVSSGDPCFCPDEPSPCPQGGYTNGQVFQGCELQVVSAQTTDARANVISGARTTQIIGVTHSAAGYGNRNQDPTPVQHLAGLGVAQAYPLLNALPYTTETTAGLAIEISQQSNSITTADYTFIVQGYQFIDPMAIVANTGAAPPAGSQDYQRQFTVKVRGYGQFVLTFAAETPDSTNFFAPVLLRADTAAGTSTVTAAIDLTFTAAPGLGTTDTVNVTPIPFGSPAWSRFVRRNA